MGYSKNDITSLVLKAVQKTPNADSKIYPAHIKKLIPAAINYAITKNYYISIKSGDGKDVSSFFVTTETLSITDNEVTLSAYPVVLPNDRSIVYVGPKSEEYEFIPEPQKQQAISKHYSEFMPTSYVISGNTITLKRIETGVTEVKVKYIASIDGFDDNTEIPIPAGLELEIINILVQFFTGERKMPEDVINDNKDV